MYSVASFQFGPNEVSPVRIRQSMPSEIYKNKDTDWWELWALTALVMSATSERVGRRRVIIESMISVERITGFFTRLHLLMMYCCMKAISSI